MCGSGKLMKRFLDYREHLGNLWRLIRWSVMVVPVGVLAGSASAFFLWSLDAVTTLRWQHGWLLYLLPVAGITIAYVHGKWGQPAEGGSDLILEHIHEPGGGVPARMAPLVLWGTLVTHLFGGSAGREGTAVQMGGSLADAFRRLFRLGVEHQRMLLMAGVAAGFGSVFGTPLAGAVFAMEVLVIGRVQYDALVPVLVASIAGDLTCSAWGAHHTDYHIGIAGGNRVEPAMLALVAGAAVCFGLASRLFTGLTSTLRKFWKAAIRFPLLRPAAGGLVIIGMVHLLGTRDYLGLGVSSPEPGAVTILSAFEAGGATPWSWWWKLLFTAITLSCGFKGGEVTPLFFIGAALGNAIAMLAGAPVDLFAGLGFIAVFAGAANTPLACTLMGVELFGAHYGVYFAVACFLAYFFSGHGGIYEAQRVGVAKRLRAMPDGQ